MIVMVGGMSFKYSIILNYFSFHNPIYLNLLHNYINIQFFISI